MYRKKWERKGVAAIKRILCFQMKHILDRVVSALRLLLLKMVCDFLCFPRSLESEFCTGCILGGCGRYCYIRFGFGPPQGIACFSAIYRVCESYSCPRFEPLHTMLNCNLQHVGFQAMKIFQDCQGHLRSFAGISWFFWQMSAPAFVKSTFVLRLDQVAV